MAALMASLGYSAADPKPQRADPKWAKAAAASSPDASAGELEKLSYNLFRKADIAWSKRKHERKAKAAAATTEPSLHPRPRGLTPSYGNGLLCTWDAERGFWLNGEKSEHDVQAAAATRRAERDKVRAKVRWQEVKAARAEERARALQQCRVIDALVRRLLHEAAQSQQLSAVFEGNAFEARLDEVDDHAWHDLYAWTKVGYRPDWRPLVALGFRPISWLQPSGKLTWRAPMLRVPWSSTYWVLVEALLAAHGGLSLGQFYEHLPAVMAENMQPVLTQMTAAGAAWHAAIEAKPKQTVEKAFPPLPVKAWWCGHCADAVEAEMRERILNQPSYSEKKQYELCLSCSLALRSL